MLKYLPVFYRVAEGTRWGKAVGPFVYLPDGADRESVLAHHERWHVRQFYFLFFSVLLSLAFSVVGLIYGSMIMVIFGALLAAWDLYQVTSRKKKLSREAAAYGESVRVSYTKHGIPEDSSASTYAVFLAGSHYGYGITEAEAKKMILDKAGSYALL